ncbi:MAG: D-alanyl-D-alanine carboxypeptidase family protein [Alphaproteobacteria bacterium]
MTQKFSLQYAWLGEDFFLRTIFFLVLLVAFVPFSEAFSKKHFVTNRPSVPYASIVMEADTGRVLHEANADTKVFPASLTKMMTLYVAFKALREGKISLDQPITVSTRAQRQEPSKLGLLKGDTLTVRQAILALVTKSANDAAVAFAEFMDRTEDQFAKRMTRQAYALGMQQTQFYNASGLPHRLQKTTARDMAILSKSLWRDFPVASQNYFKITAFQFRGVTHKNHNHLLGKVEGVDGMKTGYIAASGFNLAASVKRKGHRLIVVVMGGKNRFWRDAHTTELINTAFIAPQKLASLTGAVSRSGSQSQEIKLASLPSKTRLEEPHTVPSLISRALAAPPTPLASKNHLKKASPGIAFHHISIAHLINRGQAAFPPFEKKAEKALKSPALRRQKKH